MEARVTGPLADALLKVVVLGRHEVGELTSSGRVGLGEGGMTMGLEVVWGEVLLSVSGDCTPAMEGIIAPGTAGPPEMSPRGMMVNNVGRRDGLKAKEPTAGEGVVVAVAVVMGMGAGTWPTPKVVSWYGAPSGRYRPMGGTGEDFPLLSLPGQDFGPSSSLSLP